jgi:hypothetical protein
MARDPRDVAISRMLYRWNRGCLAQKRQYKAHLDLVRQKERDPHSIPFYEICRYATHSNWPCTKQAVIDGERWRYKNMQKFVSGLNRQWFRFTYEDMVRNNTEALNEYLGFEVQQDAQVPESSGKAKVVRKKSTGDWRHWFTEDDVALYKSVYLPYMALVGFDCEDWALSTNPVIEPVYSSAYMQSLTERVTRDAALRIKERALRLFRRVS